MHGVEDGVGEGEPPRELSFSESATHMEVQCSGVGMSVNNKAQGVRVAVGLDD
jgi:hypothetical protein